MNAHIQALKLGSDWFNGVVLVVVGHRHFIGVCFSVGNPHLEQQNMWDLYLNIHARVSGA